MLGWKESSTNYSHLFGSPFRHSNLSRGSQSHQAHAPGPCMLSSSTAQKGRVSSRGNRRKLCSLCFLPIPVCFSSHFCSCQDGWHTWLTSTTYLRVIFRIIPSPHLSSAMKYLYYYCTPSLYKSVNILPVQKGIIHCFPYHCFRLSVFFF